MKHRGSCHCGKVTIEFEGDIDTSITCNCSICSKRGSLLWFTSRDAVQVTGEEELATYTFNRHVIKHRFCKTCGILPFDPGRDLRVPAPIDDRYFGVAGPRGVGVVRR